MEYAYEVIDCTGCTVSRHHKKDRAIASARAEVAALGLTDDGIYCSSDGWPSIVARDGERVDY